MSDTFSPNHETIFWKSETFEIIKLTFWVLYVILPMLTGWLAYDWLPNESFYEKRHIAVSSHTVLDRDGNEAEIIDQWQHKETGRVYSMYDFADHKASEAVRMSIVSLFYGLIGCLFFSGARHVQNRSSFFEAFGKSMTVNLVVAIYTWLHIH